MKGSLQLNTTSSLLADSLLTVMEESFDHDVRPYLDLVDALRHIGVHQEISLSQIAVMGDQVN